MLKKLLTDHVVPKLIFVLIYSLSTTLRLTVLNRRYEEEIRKKKGQPLALSMWHNRLLYLPYHFRKQSDRFHILTSASGDGEMNARVMGLFGYGVVLGSSFKNAVKAVLALKRLVNAGNSVVLVADGSRGPIYQMQPGALLISKLTGAPALPVAVAFSRYWSLKTWDRLRVPKPFAKVVVIYGEPVTCPADADAELLQERQSLLESRLRAITAQADDYFTQQSATKGHDGD
ncbi:MAG: lysophospholipid acyltransferase family protein [Gammaproteobacteria bacterium]|nr:lysophospholipid acyltransferase family protein [Gammaproteobacteria bacterium]